MDSPDTQTAMNLLSASQTGNGAAGRQLVELIYDEFRALAAAMMRGERGGHTLQPTDLVHRALERLFAGNALDHIKQPGHLRALVARAMRRALVDHARAKATGKRCGVRIPLDDTLAHFEENGVDVLNLNEALTSLADVDLRRHDFVEQYFFAGMTLSEIADLHGVSNTTVANELQHAKAWLRNRLSKGSAR